MQASWSPSGRRIAYWGMPSGTGQRDLWTLDVGADKAEPVRVTADVAIDWNPVWSRDGGRLYFASDRGGTMNVWSVPLDEASGRVLGEPEALTLPAPGAGFLSLSRDGRQLAYTAQQSRSRLFRAELDPRTGALEGALRPALELASDYWMPDVSPDGKLVVLAAAGPREDLYLVGADGSGFVQLTDDEARDRGPRFSPDGERIAFYSNRGGRYSLWLINRDGSGLRRLSERPTVAPPVWSPDGTRLAADA
jgi:TolB protein